MASENHLPPYTAIRSAIGECSVAVDLIEMAPRRQDVSWRKQTKLSFDDYEKLVAYVEDLENFASLHGAERKTRIGGGKCLTKATAFNIMVAQLSGKNGFPSITGDELKKRFTCYVDMFKKVKELQDSTGGGLSKEEIAAGMTLEAKLNMKCPHFFRMNSIFGSRANIDPPALASLGVCNAKEMLGVDSQSLVSQFPEDTVTIEKYGEERAAFNSGDVSEG